MSSNCATVDSSVGVAELSTLAAGALGHVSWVLSTKECGDVPEAVEESGLV